MMKAFLLAGALVGSVVASFHEHHHGVHQHKHKRGLDSYSSASNATCGVTVYTTYYYGAPTLVQAPTSTSTPCTTSTSTSSATSSVAAVSTHAAPSYKPKPKPKPQPKPKPKSKPKPKPAPAPAAYGGPSTNGNKWGLTYTPYDDTTGHCKSASQVQQDIQKIHAKGFNTVRTYSTDCGGLENIGAACEALGMKMILGVYISSTGTGAAYSQVTDIVNWAKWGLVEMIVVGNECIFNTWCDAPGLAGFIGTAKAAFQRAGYSGPVTTSEPLNIWQAVGHELCGAIDVIGSNVQSYFNSDVVAATAGDFVLSELALLEAICPGKAAYNLESGWPKNGNRNGNAIAGFVEQKLAIASIIEKAGTKSIIFSFSDDAWKEPGSYGVEQFFGCLDTL